MKENVRLFAIIGFLFLVLYIFFAAKPFGKELSLTPYWTISITDKEVFLDSEEKPETVLPFKLGQNMGYFTPKGNIVLLESFPFKASISKNFRSSYSQDADNIRFSSYDTDKNIKENLKSYNYIKGSGFPFFVEDRIFLFMPGGFGFSKCDNEGNISWSFNNYVPLISFSSSEAGISTGYADGTIIVFDNDGNIRQTLEPGGSTYPVILGSDLSKSGKQFACISGIDRQRFVLNQEKNGFSKVVFHRYLDTDQKEPVLVQFSEDEKTVYYNCSKGLGIVNCETFVNKIIPLKGKIISIQEAPLLNLTCVLTKSINEYSIYFIEDFDHLIGNFSFEASSAFITIEDNMLFIGKNDEISCVKMEQK
ncbi:MAG: hypothetical protein IKZ04_01835 [Spirochaetaceae bacterium]|nr:hypothetical protein [Spirochaetaceae bacterium]